ncbi:MAG: hypothetical protein GKR77_07480, partial [Legionellales bacterium]|nr:hypothetical protein [Legionellales bacterium]
MNLNDAFPNSRKIYLHGQHHPELRVPMREIQLTNGDTFITYDTSGGYTDPKITTDVE